MFDGQRFGEQVVEQVRGFVERALLGLSGRVEALERYVPVIPMPGPKGDKGDAGERGPLPDADAVRAAVRESMPPAAEIVKEALPVIQVLVNATEDEARERIEGLIDARTIGLKGEKGDPGESIRGEKGEIGPAGPKGEPGKEVDPVAIVAAIEEGIAEALPRAVERALTALLPDIIRRAAEAVPKPQDGQNGAPGRDADDAAILASVTEHMLRAVEALPKARDGRDGKDAPEVDEPALVAKVLALVPAPKEGLPGKDAEVDYDRIEGVIREVVPVAVKEEVAQAVAAIPVPQRGDPGPAGKDADEEAIVHRVAEHLKVHFPTPKDGKDGESVDFDAVVAKAVSLIPVPKDGANGTSVTMEDVRPVMEAETARWQLEFERRASDVLRDAIEKMPKPADGKDGSNGLSVEDFEVTLEGRTFTFALRCGERVVEKKIKVPFPVDRGVYKSGAPYEKGDVVTYGGAQWIALKDTKEKPPSDSWRLQVARGRDGKDAE